MVSKINQSPKTIQKRSFSKWIHMLKSGLTQLPLISLLIFSITNFSSQTYGQSIDFKQAQNGDPAAFPVDFTNGILNATQTTYYEGLGIPQRMIFTGLDPAAAKYTVYFRFLAGIPNKGVHAYDF